MGLGGGVLDVKNAYRPVWHRDWDPVWAIAQSLDYPISFHSGRKRGENEQSAVGTMGAPTGDDLRLAAIGMSLLQFHGSADYFGIIFGGALDRFPDLKIVLGESGIGWIPSLLERMDWQYENEFTGIGLAHKPSEYWSRQMYATFQSDLVGMHLLDFLGEDRVMYASDYPHPDGTWPDSASIIKSQMAHLSESTRHKLVHDNAASLYKTP
jgi:predicted TIM-barrel fold metal-dependent hydrolase